MAISNSTPYRVLQCAFTAGEISEDVKNRVDLDKYRFCLLKADNALIRTCGPIYKRPGMEYCAAAKYANKKAILFPFSSGGAVDYMLEIGDKYIRVYKEGVYQNIEIVTPFEENILDKLRFTQSADSLFIASGKYPLKRLARYSNGWQLSNYSITKPYFDERLGDFTEDCTVTPSAKSGTVTLTSNENIFDSAMVGGYIQLKQEVESDTVSEKVTSSSGTRALVGTYTSSQMSNGGSYLKVSISGTWEGTVYLQKNTDGTNWSNVNSFTSNTNDSVPIEGGIYRLSAVLTSGTSITAVLEDYENESLYVSISLTASTSCWISRTIYAGDGWKVISHGTWKGNFEVQYSPDGTTWKQWRKYSSNEDYNPSESGSLTEGRYMRIYANITSGTATIDLTALSYTHTGYAEITGFTSANTITVKTVDDFGSTASTKKWAFSVWNNYFGFAKTVCFFQDRLVLGGTNKQPYNLWMSRSGDYNNFSIEQANGSVTDDSCVAASFVSRKQYQINHLIPATDLLVLTNGNEWIVSGSEVVTPSNITPKLQSARGCNDVEPSLIGNRLVYVQIRGSSVRDMGYSYETDSYGGSDLTTLAKQIIQDTDIIDGAYKQEPDSSIYYVRDDGTMACLAYVHEQNVYAWTTFTTKGKVLAVTSIQENDEDVVYVLVERKVNNSDVRYIERMRDHTHTANPNDYIVLDSAKTFSSDSKTNTLTVAHLAGCKVDAVGDGRLYKGYTVGANGTLTLPGSANKWTVGLPYRFAITLPEINLTSAGSTSQGLFCHIPTLTLRLFNSLGGNISVEGTAQEDNLNYDEYLSASDVVLFTGDKELSLPLGGYTKDNRVNVFSDDPYPFYLEAIIREVVFGG